MNNFCANLAATLGGRAVVIENESEYLNSAVLVPLIQRNGAFEVLFEVRAAHLNRQPSEICFPGGRIELSETALEAAVRETSEELGITTDQIHVLGSLNYVVAPIGIILHPFVAVLADDVVLVPNTQEVAEIFTVPLAWLLAAEPQEALMEVATRPLDGFPLHLLPPDYPDDWKRRKTYPVLFYQYERYVIWGLTARVLEGFIRLCREAWQQNREHKK